MIRLAILAMSVPSPPRFVPMIRDLPSSVNADKSIAAGTLLIICEDKIAAGTG